MLQVDLAIARCAKYASGESGDIAEIVERPAGGASVVLVDGQGSGAAARAIAMLVAGRTVSLLRDGVREERVASATADFLHVHRRGQVSATLDIVSVDVPSGRVLLVRNNPTSAYCRLNNDVCQIGLGSTPIGPLREPRAAVSDFEPASGLQLVVVTDGVMNVGGAAAQRPDVATWMRECGADLSAQHLADAIMTRALEIDAGRPRDDMTVVAISIGQVEQEHQVRRMSLSFPMQVH